LDSTPTTQCLWAFITVLNRTAPSIMCTSDFIINGNSSRSLYLCLYSFLWKIITLDFIAYDIHVSFYCTIPQKSLPWERTPFYSGFVLPPALYQSSQIWLWISHGHSSGPFLPPKETSNFNSWLCSTCQAEPSVNLLHCRQSQGCLHPIPILQMPSLFSWITNQRLYGVTLFWKCIHHPVFFLLHHLHHLCTVNDLHSSIQ